MPSAPAVGNGSAGRSGPTPSSGPTGTPPSRGAQPR
jgi:hypothetical protein